MPHLSLVFLVTSLALAALRPSGLGSDRPPLEPEAALPVGLLDPLSSCAAEEFAAWSRPTEEPRDDEAEAEEEDEEEEAAAPRFPPLDRLAAPLPLGVALGVGALDDEADGGQLDSPKPPPPVPPPPGPPPPPPGPRARWR